MKRPLAYITAAWLGGDSENAEQAARYCRAVYEAGFSPICPSLYLPLFLNDAVTAKGGPGRTSCVRCMPWLCRTMGSQARTRTSSIMMTSTIRTPLHK